MHIAKQSTSESKVFFTFEDDKRITKSIQTHPFNASVCFCYEASANDPLDKIESPVYYITILALSSLLGPELLPLIRSKALFARSQTDVDFQDAYCVADGVLTMSLLKDTYQRFGIEGKQSRLSRGKYIIEVNLASNELGKLLTRLRHSLDVVLGTPVSFEMYFIEDDLQIPPEILSGRQVCQRRTLLAERDIPDFQSIAQEADKQMRSKNASPSGLFREVQEDVATHMALMTLASSMPEQVDPYISVYACPSPSSRRSVMTHTLDGLIPASHVLHVLSVLQETVGIQWFYLQIQGHAHCPIAWTQEEHGYLVGGENCIAVLDTLQANKSGLDEDLRKTFMWETVGGNDKHN